MFYQVVAKDSADTVKDPVFFLFLFLIICPGHGLVFILFLSMAAFQSLLLSVLALLCNLDLLLLLFLFSLPNGVLAILEPLFTLLESVFSNMLLLLSILYTKKDVKRKKISMDNSYSNFLPRRYTKHQADHIPSQRGAPVFRVGVARQLPVFLVGGWSSVLPFPAAQARG